MACQTLHASLLCPEAGEDGADQWRAIAAHGHGRRVRMRGLRDGALRRRGQGGRLTWLALLQCGALRGGGATSAEWQQGTAASAPGRLADAHRPTRVPPAPRAARWRWSARAVAAIWAMSSPPHATRPANGTASTPPRWCSNLRTAATPCSGRRRRAPRCCGHSRATPAPCGRRPASVPGPEWDSSLGGSPPRPSGRRPGRDETHPHNRHPKSGKFHREHD